jgi:FeS assembly protein IscX
LLWLFSLTSLAWCGFSWPHSPKGPLTLGLCLIGLVLYATVGVLWPQCGMYGEALSRGKVGARRVALTFDDGPHPVTTRAVLALLRAHDARATFFVLGHKVEAHPDVDPRTIRFTDLHRWVMELPGFDDDPARSGEKVLEAIQAAWIEEV